MCIPELGKLVVCVSGSCSPLRSPLFRPGQCVQSSLYLVQVWWLRWQCWRCWHPWCHHQHLTGVGDWTKLSVGVKCHMCERSLQTEWSGPAYSQHGHLPLSLLFNGAAPELKLEANSLMTWEFHSVSHWLPQPSPLCRVWPPQTQTVGKRLPFPSGN